MPKLSRAKQRKLDNIEVKKLEPPPPAALQGPGIRDVRHIKCPVCGLMARDDLIEHGPYVPEARVQHYGGTLPSPTGKMADRPGVLYWDPKKHITATDRKLLLVKIEEARGFVSDHEA